jgi:hypothetical protein
MRSRAARRPSRDMAMDTLRGVLAGEIIVHNHCYRADEMAIVLDMAKEFGYKVGTFHHAVEAYKIADLLKANGTCAAVWADWWGFKMESYDAISENLAVLEREGACGMIHSDDANGIQRLNQEIAKVRAAAKRAGFTIPEEIAWKWVGDHAGQGARRGQGDRQPEGGQDGGRGAVERQSVQRLHAPRERSGSTARCCSTCTTPNCGRCPTSSWASPDRET